MTSSTKCRSCQGTGIVKWTISGIVNGEYYCMRCEKGKRLHRLSKTKQSVNTITYPNWTDTQ